MCTDAAAHGDVSQRGGQVRFADSDRSQDQGPVRGVEESQAGEFVPQLLVETDRCGGVPAFQAHALVEAGGTGA
jgi:hypothetical protein